MKKLIILTVAIATVVLYASCSENYGTGERIGVITKFARSGLVYKSWEGELHVTQTGMNSTMTDFDFSIDNDVEEKRANVINAIDSAAKWGWKVRLHYHEVQGTNITHSRGETNFFVDSVQVLDKNIATLFNNGIDTAKNRGRVVDTIYVVIDKTQLRK